MDIDKLFKAQEQERDALTKEIINSPGAKKLVISGPGTGKTYFFDKIIKKQLSGKYLVITFIRRLIADIDKKVQIENTCKTFHEFAKGILHTQKGTFDLQPFLSEIIKKDAILLGLDLNNFDSKFQELDEYGPEIPFYLKRGDYYQTVSFNDSVYRVYKLSQQQEKILPQYDQIIVDEYQDFNKLETEFIKILEKKGPILIAGDDDQALYDGRSASSKYIKDLYRSERYKIFKPKYCSRCPSVIVNSVNSFIKKAQGNGYFKDRIDKDYECYLPEKAADSNRFPKIDFVECSTIKTVTKYIQSSIKKIGEQDIKDSFKESEEYPTVLVIGPVHYLKVVYEGLSKTFKNVQFNPSEQTPFSIVDAYRILRFNEFSNLGWRIIAELFLDEDLLTEIITETENNVKIIDLLPSEIVNHHKAILDLITNISDEATFKSAHLKSLKKLSPGNYDELIVTFKYKAKNQKSEIIDKTEPSVLLTSYKGAKGLSGGYVFLLGAHNKSLPKNKNQISDVEISQFIVAITRTRKKLYLINNRWYINPMTKDKKFMDSNERSIFIDWIPNGLINNIGYLRSEDIV